MSDTLSVKELCDSITKAISNAFGSEIWVEGMISGLKRAANGHVYFDLIDSNSELGASTKSVISVALFASTKMGVNRVLTRAGGNIKMVDGIKIRIRGEVNYYPPSGRVSFVMSMIDPEYTLGKMELDKKQLLEKLKSKGLLEKNSTLKIPMLPTNIALLTSLNSAAHADFTNELGAKGFNFDLKQFDVRVQGEDAIISISNAIDSAISEDADLIVLIRGGGARSDLVAFDSEQLATKIANCGTPVICGVGHEIDRSVIDEVSHTSVKTPTAAASFIVNIIEDAISRFVTSSSLLVQLAVNTLQKESQLLSNSVHSLDKASTNAIGQLNMSLANKSAALQNQSLRLLENSSSKLHTAEKQLGAFDPKLSLKRGWSITHDSEGNLVKQVADASADTKLVTTVSDGTIESTVDK